MFQRARTQQQIENRKKEIIQAMDTLYAQKELNDIYLKDIAESTKITRTAIYSYYKNKEEILLDSLHFHFIRLDDGLEELLKKEKMDKYQIIDEMTALLVENYMILKIMSTDLETIEKHTTLEKLIELKKEFKHFQLCFQDLMIKNFPESNKETIKFILYTFIALLYGYYPLTNPSLIQKEAMEKTNTTIHTTLKELIAQSLTLLFQNL